MTVRWVRQEHTMGCSIAGLAMVTGKTYQEVYDWFSQRYKRRYSNTPPEPFDVNKYGGMASYQWEAYLHENGYATQTKYKSLCNEDRPEWPVSPWADIHLCCVETSMSHCVVLLRDGTVLDPNTQEKRTLKDYARCTQIIAVYKIAQEAGDV